MMRPYSFVRLVTLMLLLGSLNGCLPATSDQPQELVVFAAASLTDAFTEIAKTHEAQNPGVTVRLNFGGSSQLAAVVEAEQVTERNNWKQKRMSRSF